MSTESFAVVEVKSLDGKGPAVEGPGEFEVVLSAETLDRDGEVILAGAFDPLPASVPIHAFHDFSDPVGRAVPRYEDGRLLARGAFASTPRAQEIRSLVRDGVIGHTSVGFMKAEREWDEARSVTLIKSAELLEASFVSVPSNREAAILAVKSHKPGGSDPAVSTSPADPADVESAGTPPASAVVELARLRAQAALLTAW